MSNQFSDLQRCFDKGEFAEALKISQKILEEQNIPEANHARVYSLLNLSKWQETVNLVSDSSDFVKEKAYALYRLNRFDEAMRALEKQNDAFAERLLPQVKYRMGKYEDCATIYKRLLKGNPDDSGMVVNLLASVVSGDVSQPRDLKAIAVGFKDAAYEVNFNLACGYLEAGLLDQAKETLNYARGILVNDLKEEDAGVDVAKNPEVAVVDVQLAVVMQRQGKTEEAKDVYNRVLKLNTGQGADEIDVTALAVAANNLTSLRAAKKNLFDSLKRINIASKESLTQKLTAKQTIAIGVNKCVFLLQANKIQDAREQVAMLLKKYPNNPKVTVAEASLHYAEKKPQKAEDTLLANKTSETVLALAQLYSLQQKYTEAMDALASLPVDQRWQPRVLEAICALCAQTQNTETLTLTMLREAIAHVQHDKPEFLDQVLRVCSVWAVKLDDQAFASAVYKQFLEEVDGTDARALSGLAEYATDPEDALIYAKKLQVPSWNHIDAEELELAVIPKVQRKKKEEDEDAAVVTSKKRKKKIRYPKNFDLENPGPIDPERWLPKYERSEYKKRMAKKTKGLIRGPQGSMPTDDQAFRNKGPSTAQTEVATGEVRRKKKGRR
eukprot:GEMP01018614.1.p1 GENE.GEMP01018614.1~~GEMP01018614.1.p1  ORF type:complete len:611 (+),score=167.85 GEMP01018614.1:141-1973(+)